MDSETNSVKKVLLPGLDTYLKRWVENGIMDVTQAATIREYEVKNGSKFRIDPTKILGLFGCLLCLMGLWVLIALIWKDIPDWAEAPVVIALHCLVCLGVFFCIRNQQYKQFAGFAAFISIFSWAFLLSVITGSHWDWDLTWDHKKNPCKLFLPEILLNLAYAFACYHFITTPLKSSWLHAGIYCLTQFFIYKSYTCIFGLKYSDSWTPVREACRLVMFYANLGWWALAYTSIVTPKTIGYVLSNVGVVYISLNVAIWMQSYHAHLSALLLLLTAAGLISYSFHKSDDAPFTPAALVIIVVLPGLLSSLLPSHLYPPLVLLIIGTTLIGVAFGLNYFRKRIQGNGGQYISINVYHASDAEAHREETPLNQGTPQDIPDTP